MTTPAARPPAFVFDPASCVGCHACAMACINEHQLAPGTFWRQIVTFNPARVPGLPTWHVSVACNHCLEAPCLRCCPALAIARDERTGAVLIDDGRCIGCRYCSWVCPYDAPRFDAARGVMQKCTFCTHRLATGLVPACASQCPTGALAVGPLQGEGTSSVTGFPRADVGPAIRFISRRGASRAAEPGSAGVPQEIRLKPDPTRCGGHTVSGDATGAIATFAVGATAQHLGPVAGDIIATPSATLRLSSAAVSAPAPKISLRHEWSLAAFTFVAIVNVGWLAGSLLGGPRVRLPAFLALGVAATALSAAHLGRPVRAWRALLDWRRSWLSREVIAWPAFLGLAAWWLAVAPGAVAPGWLAAAMGVACLACVDRVYAVMARPRRAALDDAAAVSAGVFLAGVLAASPALVLVAGVYRLAAFVQRRQACDRGASRPRWRHPAVRVGLGLVAPAVLALVGVPSWHLLGIASALVGEALDRADFYASLDVETPSGAMARAVLAALRPGAREAA